LKIKYKKLQKNTEWNGTKILDGSQGSVNIQAGANASQTIAVQFADLNTIHGVGTENTEAGAGANSSGALDIFTNLGNDDVTTDTASGDSVEEDKDLDAQVITGSAQATTLAHLDRAIARLDAHRATLGSTINRLEYAADNLANVSQNTSASRSRILDADYASETTELARTQIIQQAGTAMLSQANQQAQSVLALLK
jgi:flagellin